MFAAQLGEVHGIARYADRQLRIVLGMLHGVFEHRTVQHVDVQVVCALRKVTVEHRHQVLDPLLFGRAQRFGDDREGIRDAVLRVAVTEFGHRGERGDGTALVASVHRVGTRCEGHALGTSVGRRAGFLAVHHVRGDGQQRKRRAGVLVDGQFLELLAEEVHEVYAQVVYAVVVVAEAGEFALDVEAFAEPLGVAAGGHLGIFDGRERVEGDRKPRHAVGEVDARVGVYERHLCLLVVVLVVHVMDDVHRLVVDAGDFGQHHLVVAHHLLEAQRALRERRDALDHQRAGVLAAAAVDGQQQRLGQVAARAEELDLAADVLVRYAAGDAVVVRMAHFAHQLVVLVLDRAGVGRNLGAEILESLRQVGAPQDREVGLGRRAEVVERLQETERGLGHLRAAVVEASADGFGHPRRVAGEDVVVGLHPQVAYHAQLDDELVDELLCEHLVDVAVRQVVFDEDVEERRHVAQRHRGAVLFLHGCEVSHVNPLHGLLCRMRRAAQVEPVVFAHRADLLQRLDLLGDLFAQADAGVGHRAGQVAQVLLLGFDQAVGAVERQAAVVADDAAAGVVVG